jgi:hypothetical protein
MQKTANDQVFFLIMRLSVGFYSQRDRFLSQQGKKAEAPWRNASFLVPVFVWRLQAVDFIQPHRALCAPHAYIPVPAVRRNKCR